MNARLLALAIAGTTLAGTAAATPFAPFDVRASGMGGTGVASAKAASAALFNPAMLSAQVEGDKFQFVLGAGVQAADEDEMFDQVDTIQTTIDALSNSITTAQGISLVLDTYYPQLQAVSTPAGTVTTQLSNISGDSMLMGLGGGLGVGVPGPSLGVGVMVGLTSHTAATPFIDPADVAKVQAYADVLSDGIVSAVEAAANPDVVTVIGGGAFSLDNYATSSSANGTAIALAEVAIGLSHRYDLANGGWLSVGVTPKAVEASTYDYTATVDNFDDGNIDASNYEKTDSGFDLDLGVVYKRAADSNWQVGLAAKNVVGNKYDTVAGRTIEVATQLRAGFARMTNRTTLAVDLDLTENDGIVVGQGTQFLALGAEYDLKYLQLRAGYRANLASSDVGDVVTAGIGLGPVDITAMASDETLGAYAQIGFGW